MKLRNLVLSILGLALAWTSAADTLRLTNGQVIYGQFVTRMSQGIQFTGQDGIRNSYPPDQLAQQVMRLDEKRMPLREK